MGKYTKIQCAGNNETAALLKNEKKFGNVRDFDQLLDAVGSKGRFQNILLYLLMGPIGIMEPMLRNNMLFLLHTPDHWCHVEGRENETVEEWKNLTIPIEGGADGRPRFSQCRMYFGNGSVTECLHGWDYDRTFYESTVPMDFDWVCGKSDYATRVFTFINVGNAAGSILLGHAADKIGRKPVVLLALFILSAAGLVGLMIPGFFGFYLVVQLLGGLASPSLIIAICLVAAETCDEGTRSWVYSLSCFLRVTGNVLLAFIGWSIPSWFNIGVATYVPAFLVTLTTLLFLPESPRWLLSVGRTEEATKILMKIARMNGRKVSEDQIFSCAEGVAPALTADGSGGGVRNLFSKRRLAKHTVLICTLWPIIALTIYCLNMNTINMSGNPFINHALLVGLIELPSGWILGPAVENFGRRWTQVALFLSVAIATGLAAVLTSNSASVGFLLALMCGKLFIIMSDLVMSLQASELLPTTLRSTGFSMASTISSFAGIIGPYLLFVGEERAVAPFLILTGLAGSGALLASLLPETLRVSLPETIDEANSIGQNAKC